MVKEFIQDKQPQSTLEADLVNAYDAQAQELPEDTELQTKPDNEIEEKGFSLEQEDINETNETEDPERLYAPEDWAADERDRFNNWDREVQDLVLKQYKNMQAGYTKKSQELSEFAKRGQAVTEELAPVMQNLRLAGYDEIGAIRSMAQVAQLLNTDPKQAIDYLARHYNVDIQRDYQAEYDDSFTVDDDEYVDPAIVRLNQKMNAIQSEFKKSQDEQQLSKVQQLQLEIDRFKKETDNYGNIAHPFFDDVRHDMIQIFNSGVAGNLGQAYEMAIHKYPEITAKRDQLRNEQKEKAEREKKKEAVRKAKKAASGIDNSTSTKVSDAPKSLRDDLLAAWDQQLNL